MRTWTLVISIACLLLSAGTAAAEPGASVSAPDFSYTPPSDGMLPDNSAATVAAAASDPAEAAARDQKVGTGLLVATMVMQGVGLGSQIANQFLFELTGFNWVVQGVSIPFAPLGVVGFSKRFGGSDPAQRLQWAGIGLLEAAAYSGLVGGIGLVQWIIQMESVCDPDDICEGGAEAIYGVTTWPHLVAAASFVVAGAVTVAVAKSQASSGTATNTGVGSSRRTAFVVPILAPTPNGLSLGLTGVF
jgi:hypothetical protein